MELPIELPIELDLITTAATTFGSSGLADYVKAVAIAASEIVIIS